MSCIFRVAFTMVFNYFSSIHGVIQISNGINNGTLINSLLSGLFILKFNEQ